MRRASAGSALLALCVTRRHGGVAAPRSRCPPVTGGRNETKRKKTKGNAEWPGLAFAALVPLLRGSGLPSRRGPARFSGARCRRGSGARSGRGGAGSRARSRGGRVARRLWPAVICLSRGTCGITGGDRGTRGGSGYVYVAWLLSARDAAGTSRQRGTFGTGRPVVPALSGGPGPGCAARVRPSRGRAEPCAGRGQRGAPGRGSLPTYTCLALGGAAAAAALSGVPDPGARCPSPRLCPGGRVPGRRGALRGSGLPERSLNTLLFLAGRPEPGRGPALPPPPSNGEAAPGPRPLLAVTCRPGAEEAPEPLAVPAEAVTKRRPPAPG